jgi:hypothetical protein
MRGSTGDRKGRPYGGPGGHSPSSSGSGSSHFSRGTLQCTYGHGACDYRAPYHVLVSRAVPAGSPPQYDLEHVCIPHLNGYYEWFREGLAVMLTEEEALVAEVMLS